MLPRELLSVLLLSSSVLAGPADISKRHSITAFSSAQVSAFKPFAYFAAAAYCNPANTLAWNCGNLCNANSNFIPVASGGDGDSVQFWYVGYSPSQTSVIVAHQGTDPSQIEADATDLNVFLEPLDSSLFPGVSSSIEVHSGFANEHAKTATTILVAVQKTISAYATSQVTIVGHSLGAALALLDGVYLPLHISGVPFKVVTYGMPRVGNQAFANYVDARLSLAHINNKKDFVPIIPGRSLGYHHPSGEVHITENNQWMSCQGQDDTSTECSVGDVPDLFEGVVNNHFGPYDGVNMGDC